MKEKSRRQFLKGAIGTLGGTVLAKMAGLFPEARPLLARSTQEAIPVVRPPTHLDVGELYAGFLLLPAEATLPEFVQIPSQTVPIVCGVGVGRGGPMPTADSEELASTDALKDELNFEMYVWDDSLHGLHLQKPNLIRYPTGDVFHVAIGIERFDEENNSRETVARISARPNFPRPYPLWEGQGNDLEDIDGSIGSLQKVDYLPVPGIMVQTINGYVFRWIENSISYTLTTEEGLSFAESREILTFLHM